MQKRIAPPGRNSIWGVGNVKPAGPHQCTRCSGLLHVSNTSARGASKTRVMRSSRVSLLFSGMGLRFLRRVRGRDVRGLKPAQVVVEAIEALLPEVPVVFEPRDSIFHGCSLEPTRPPLRVAAA